MFGKIFLGHIDDLPCRSGKGGHWVQSTSLTAVAGGGGEGHQCLHTSKPSKLRNGSSASAITIITNQGRGRRSPCVRVCRRHIPELGESERLHRGQGGGGSAKQNSLRGLCGRERRPLPFVTRASLVPRGPCGRPASAPFFTLVRPFTSP